MDDLPCSFSEEDFLCPVCRDVFKHPVILSCSHSFCRGCLCEWWTHQAGQCPVCKATNSAEHPTCNLALKNLCEAYGRERHEPQEAEVPREAEDESLEFLREKLKAFAQAKTACNQTAEHIKVQAQNAEQTIQEQFERIRRFLREEEDARIAALREEESRKSQAMREKIDGLDTDMSALSRVIGDAAGEPRPERDAGCEDAATESTRESALCDLQPAWGALIDTAKHLGNLTFKVWRKMLQGSDGIVSYTPVILDPNTANRELALSDDLTAVSCGGQAHLLPDNPERIDWWCRVLGAKGFSRGRHRWEVEVGDNANWTLGVLADSFERKGRGGGPFWVTLHLNYGELTVESPARPLVVLQVTQKPRRVRVRLDCDGGKLTFSDPDAGVHLHTFVNNGGSAFADTLFPYVGNTDACIPLRMLPRKLRVVEDDDIDDYN